MSEEYKLTYFNLRGLAEPIRFILALADVPYEDIRIEKENWPELKAKYTWGQLPVLQVGDKQLAQSSTIGRYLARKYKLTGEDDVEAAKCDELIDALSDVRQEWRKFFMESDEGKKAELKKTLLETQIPKYFNKFSAIKEENGGQWMVGKNVTWADIHLAIAVDFFGSTVDASVLESFPQLKALKDSVYELPQIKAWLEKRPVTAM
jgi:glutathione S-transferase